VSERKKRLHGYHPDHLQVAKPGAPSLFRHIVRAAVLDGMQWPVVFCITLVSALYYFDFAYHDSLAILIITGIVATGLLRGCQAWQNDLNDYQRQLALARHERSSAEKRNSIPGCFPTRRY
jgi:hypothetical protein